MLATERFLNIQEGQLALFLLRMASIRGRLLFGLSRRNDPAAPSWSRQILRFRQRHGAGPGPGQPE